MSWVTIDQDKCNQCGICARRCVRCFTNQNGVITVQADEQCCNICGHCVALCTAGAITHSKMDMENFPLLTPQIRFDPDEFIRFVRQRRSHRGYKEKKVPDELLKKLIEMCRYIPTGSNMQSVQIKVITNKAKIKQLSSLTVDYFQGMIAQVEIAVRKLQKAGKEIPPELEAQRIFVNRYSRLAMARELGLDPILHQAPVVMLFHSPPNPSTPKDDCVIAAQTVVLAAETMGLGTCYIGLLTNAALNDAPVKAELGLPEENTVYSVLVMGYPRLKFQRAVDRKPITVQWEE
jgi:nitroreductase/NAD-dependent dihydropyrimidine dehydrogenase PreA subunit